MWGGQRGDRVEGAGAPSAAHKALPAEPGSGVDGPDHRLFSYTRVSVACGPLLTASVRLLHCLLDSNV